MLIAPSHRLLFTLGFLACAVLIGVALYFEHVMNLEPCPLCMVQRVLVIIAGVVFLAAALHGSRGWGTRVYGALTILVGGAGIAVAGRHVWLQHLPEDQVPECGPGLEFMLEAFPLSETIKKVFQGSGECAEVVWRFLGLSIPEWTLIVFCAMAAFGLYLVFTRKQAVE